MICEKSVKNYCKEYWKIENYDKAINDDSQIWECHHKLETHNSDGERRLVDLSREELIALDMYFYTEPSYLIFMTISEHRKLHMEHPGKNHYIPSFSGHKHTEENKSKVSAKLKNCKGHNHPIGMKFWNNGHECIRATECPGPDWNPGRLHYSRG